jgi:hypothetical protein
MGRALLSAAIVLALVPARTAWGGSDRERTEFDLVPIVGGNSDVGFGGGAVGALTHFAPGSDEQSWAWRIEANALVTFRLSPSADIPYQDYLLLLTVPQLRGGKLRLTARGAFTQETDVRYFGLGNATPAPPDQGSARYLYGRTHPTVEGHARLELAPYVYATAGGSFTVDWFAVPTDGLLANEMRAGSPEVKSLLGSARTDAVATLDESVSWDDRDDEVVPHRGSWDELTVRLSPRIGDVLPYGFTEILANARLYVPVGSRVVVALRGIADGLIGSPPFYHLAEYDQTYAIGGALGVRGVPGERYYGKVKLLTNLEVRTDVARFRAVGKPWGLDLVGFFDAGRLWADWFATGLDGGGLGLKWGTGVGIRVEQGSAFVVRADIAWSPDATPIAGYFAAGEIF